MRFLALSLALASAAQASDAVTEQTVAPRRGKGFIIAGIASSATLYTVNVGVAALFAVARASTPDTPPSPLTGLFIPVVGPFVALANPSNRSAESIAFLLGDGLLQLAGVGFLVLGELQYFSGAATETAWLVLPGVANAPLGATLTLRLP